MQNSTRKYQQRRSDNNAFLTCAQLIEEVVVDDVGEEGEDVSDEGQHQERLPPVVVGPGAGEEAEEDGGDADEQQVPSLELGHARLNALLHGFFHVSLCAEEKLSINSHEL